MARLLVVEDERKVRRGLEQALRSAGYEVEAAATGGDGLARHGRDVRLPRPRLDAAGSGRAGHRPGTAGRRPDHSHPPAHRRDAIDDRVFGLEAGADDYLVKPFALAELLARVMALLRRGQPDRETVLRAAGLEIDRVRRRVTRDGAEVALTQREFAVLEYLARHKGRTVTREMLGRDVWDDPNYALTNVVEVYVNPLRKKLDPPAG